MHLTMIFLVIGCAWLIRLRWSGPRGTITQRWRRSLFLFMIPPLLVLSTALSIFCMGPTGQLVAPWEGWLSYCFAVGFLLYALSLGFKIVWYDWRSCQYLKHFPRQHIQGRRCRVLDNSQLFCAQVGLWKPQLVVSQGLLKELTSEQLESVLYHEQAHVQFQDIPVFAILSGLKQLLSCFPYSTGLFQELLILRERRADQWAAELIDPLTLAESLVIVARNPLRSPSPYSAGVSCAASLDRLQERIQALLHPQDNIRKTRNYTDFALSICISALPLLVVPFHQ